MADVARRAGVHPATVSRALSQAPGVSDAVRARIQQCASELGYRPNPLVSALIRTRRSPHRLGYHATLAYLIPAVPGREDAYRVDYAELFAGAQTRAMDFGYRLEEFSPTVARLPSQRLSTILAARAIPGVLLAPLKKASDIVDLDLARFAVVAVGFSQRTPVRRVVHNHFGAVRTALAECRRRHYDRIGLVLPRRVNEKVENRWVAAYVTDFFERGSTGTWLPPLILDEENDHEVFRIWLRDYRPNVIIGLQHLTPILHWLQVDGIRVPDDIGLVTLDQRDGKVAFAGIYQDYRMLGATAIEQLVSLVERNERGLCPRATSLSLAGVWRDGETLKPLQDPQV